MLTRDEVPKTFDAELFASLTNAVAVGDVVTTLSTGSRNEIVEITPDGIHVRTERSSPAANEVPAWMFNVVWYDLKTNGSTGTATIDSTQLRRSSAVFAVLARLPDVEVVSSRPIELRLRRQ